MSYARSWWQVLGVPFDADEVLVKRSYRQLAHECHPDHGGSTEKMQELNAAYESATETLEKREAEQRYHANPFRAYGPRPGEKVMTPEQAEAERSAMWERRQAEAVRQATGYHREAVVRVSSYKPTDDEIRRGQVAAILG